MNPVKKVVKELFRGKDDGSRSSSRDGSKSRDRGGLQPDEPRRPAVASIQRINSSTPNNGRQSPTPGLIGRGRLLHASSSESIIPDQRSIPREVSDLNTAVHRLLLKHEIPSFAWYCGVVQALPTTEVRQALVAMHSNCPAQRGDDVDFKNYVKSEFAALGRLKTDVPPGEAADDWVVRKKTHHEFFLPHLCPPKESPCRPPDSSVSAALVACLYAENCSDLLLFDSFQIVRGAARTFFVGHILASSALAWGNATTHYIVISGSSALRNPGLHVPPFRRRLACEPSFVPQYLAELDRPEVTALISAIIGWLSEEDHRVIVCGHGLGGAAASILSLQIITELAAPALLKQLHCITFGCPPFLLANEGYYNSQCGDFFSHHYHTSDVLWKVLATALNHAERGLHDIAMQRFQILEKVATEGKEVNVEDLEQELSNVTAKLVGKAILLPSSEPASSPSHWRLKHPKEILPMYQAYFGEHSLLLRRLEALPLEKPHVSEIKGCKIGRYLLLTLVGTALWRILHISLPAVSVKGPVDVLPGLGVAQCFVELNEPAVKLTLDVKALDLNIALHDGTSLAQSASLTMVSEVDVPPLLEQLGKHDVTDLMKMATHMLDIAELNSYHQRSLQHSLEQLLLCVPVGFLMHLRRQGNSCAAEAARTMLAGIKDDIAVDCTNAADAYAKLCSSGTARDELTISAWKTHLLARPVVCKGIGLYTLAANQNVSFFQALTPVIQVFEALFSEPMLLAPPSSRSSVSLCPSRNVGVLAQLYPSLRSRCATWAMPSGYADLTRFVHLLVAPEFPIAPGGFVCEHRSTQVLTKQPLDVDPVVTDLIGAVHGLRKTLSSILFVLLFGVTMAGKSTAVQRVFGHQTPNGAAEAARTTCLHAFNVQDLFWLIDSPGTNAANERARAAAAGLLSFPGVAVVFLRCVSAHEDAAVELLCKIKQSVPLRHVIVVLNHMDEWYVSLNLPSEEETEALRAEWEQRTRHLSGYTVVATIADTAFINEQQFTTLSRHFRGAAIPFGVDVLREKIIEALQVHLKQSQCDKLLAWNSNLKRAQL